MTGVEEAVILRCIRPDIKEALLAEVDHPGLRALPKCGDGSAIGFAMVPGGTKLVKYVPEADVEAPSGPRKKRAPSEYNLFIGKCMKQGEAMKACSVQWKQKRKP